MLPRVVVVAVLALLAVTPAANGAGRCGSPSERPWCDTAKPADERASLLLAQLTQDEKFQLMAGDDPIGVFNPPLPDQHTGTSRGVERPGVSVPTVFFSDGPVGPRQGKATAMPSPLGLAAAFDPSLAARHAGVVGAEARAKGNDVVHAPTINIMRTPLGGRTFEAFGEDPHLQSEIAVDWIRGLEREGVVGNVKHFAANNQETDRFTTDAQVDERTLREIYLPAFEASVKDARSGTVMCAYNRVNGAKACENDPLLNGILKREWGFPGFVLSDYGFAVFSTEGAANGGLDLEMPQEGAYSRPLLTAETTAGRISAATIDDHVRRLLRTYFARGIFDRQAYPNDTGRIDQEGHAKVAREVEQASIVLLKNEQALLPVARGVKSIAVIGPDADRFKTGGGSSMVDPIREPVTPCDGIAERAGPGVRVTCDDGRNPVSAAALARASDLAVVVASDAQTEFKDKPCLGLACDNPQNGDQDGLISTVAAANPRTAVLLETGGPVLMPWEGQVPAIVQAWYPGQEGGAAIARVIFGDVNPGGRLPVSIPRREADYPTAGNPRQYPGLAENAEYSEGVFVGYRHYDERGIAPLFPFGHGLSYTRFRFRGLSVERLSGAGTAQARGDARYRVGATVTNTGGRSGATVAQLYLRLPDPRPGVTQPPAWLRGFAKVRLRAGQSRRVSLTVDSRALAYWEAEADSFAIAPGCYGVMVGGSSRDIRLRGEIAEGGAATTTARRVRLRRGRATVRLALRRGGRPIGGATVAIEGAGVSRTARTGAGGRAVVRVRASRSGSVRVSTTACNSSLSVSAAQAGAPRFTG